MSDFVSGDMVRGHIDSIILNSLLDSDKDTGMIREEIEKRASGKFQLKQGTFYSALQRIVKNGLVIEYRTTGNDGVRRKFFQLTEKGKAHIEKNQNSWTVSQEIINTLLDSEGPQVKFHKPSDYVRVEKTEQPEEKVPVFSAEPEDEVKIPKFNDVYNDSPEEIETELAASINENGELTDADAQNSANQGEIIAEKQPEHGENAPDNVLFFDNSHVQEEAAPTTFDDILDMLAKAEERRLDEEQADEQDLEIKTFEKDFVQLSIDEKIAEKTNETTSETANTNINDGDVTVTQSATQTATPSENAYVNDFSELSLSDEEKRIREAERRAREAEEAKIEAEKQRLIRKKQEEEARIAEAERIARENAIAQIKAEEEAEKRAALELENAKNQANLYGENDNLINLGFGSALNQSQASADDDYLKEDDLPNQKEYRDILNRIFANEVSPAAVSKEQKTHNEPEKVEEIQSDVIVDTLDFSSMRRHERAQDLFADEEDKENKKASAQPKKNRTESEKKSNNAVGYDYSDIIKLSEEEGFKISTADNTNKSDLGKILINKLNFHTALIFFAVVALETLVVALTMEGTAKLGVGAYFIFLGVIALLPAVFGVIYYLTPKRVINEIGTFKGSFETALIITLNLVLLTIAVSIVTNLDFSSATQLSRGIFIPVMVSINVPVFVIVRYSLLENQAYFS